MPCSFSYLSAKSLNIFLINAWKFRFIFNPILRNLSNNPKNCFPSPIVVFSPFIMFSSIFCDKR